jgi:hypothetical protein
MRQFSDRVDWDAVSEYQTLSEDFVREFQNKVNREKIKPYQDKMEE